jgi:hypothetical protein
MSPHEACRQDAYQQRGVTNNYHLLQTQFSPLNRCTVKVCILYYERNPSAQITARINCILMINTWSERSKTLSVILGNAICLLRHHFWYTSVCHPAHFLQSQFVLWYTYQLRGTYSRRKSRFLVLGTTIYRKITITTTVHTNSVSISLRLVAFQHYWTMSLMPVVLVMYVHIPIRRLM